MKKEKASSDTLAPLAKCLSSYSPGQPMCLSLKENRVFRTELCAETLRRLEQMLPAYNGKETVNSWTGRPLIIVK